MAHTRPEVSDTHICLFGPSQVRLRDQHVTHTEHAQTSQLLRCVEHNGREPTGHFRVQTNLDTGLDFVFTFHKKIQQILRIYHSFSEVSHQADQGSIPLVHNL